jgi:hypothetical protein
LSIDREEIDKYGNFINQTGIHKTSLNFGKIIDEFASLKARKETFRNIFYIGHLFK